MAAVLVERFVGTLDDRRGAGVRLQAAPAAAAALAGVRDFNPVVTDFGTMTVLALYNAVADDDAAAHARPEREQHHAMGVFSRSDPVFPHGSRVGVVLESCRNLESILNVLAHGNVLP